MSKRLLAALRALAAAAALFASMPASAAQPLLVFRHGAVTAESGEYRVDTGLLQLELAPGIVASASSGTRFSIQPQRSVAEGYELTVSAGELRIMDVDRNRIALLEAGRYDYVLHGVDPGSRDARIRELDYRPGILLTDRVMLLQAEALKIDTQQFVRTLFSLFRRGAAR